MQKHHTSYSEQKIKAWINFNGIGATAIRDSFNVSAIVDEGVGIFTINWDTDFAAGNYAIAGFAANDSETLIIASDVADVSAIYLAGSVRIDSLKSSDSTRIDAEYICVLAIGD